MITLNGMKFENKDLAMLWNLIRNEFEHINCEIRDLRENIQDLQDKREQDIIKDRDRLQEFKARINAGFVLGLISLLGVAFTAIFVVLKTFK